jgi:mRNA interferase MazF
MCLEVKRGEIWIADFSFVPEGVSLQRGNKRPVAIISNDKCNKFSPVITCVPVTGRMDKKQMITHILIGVECGLDRTSYALCEQIMSLNKKYLLNRVGELNDLTLDKVEQGLKIQQGIQELVDYSKLTEMTALLLDVEESIQKGYEYDINIRMKNCLEKELKMYCKQHGVDYDNLIKHCYNTRHSSMIYINPNQERRIANA